ncbi:MAG TPA: hypothetical protein VG013_13460, partial [Gemmataceae bacterium]|nr:hypothetical protein [Gemmataceae bacterium]
MDEDRAGLKRAELFNLIEELVLWENSNNPRVINKARAEIARCVASRKIETGELKKDKALGSGIRPNSSATESAAHSGECGYGGATPWDFVTRQASAEAVNAFLAEHAPPVLDPFCGGGSIPLEAQRLGLRAYASDLNPVAVLITKALIEIPPKFAGRPPVNPGWQQKKPDEKAMKAWSGAQGLAEDIHYYARWMRSEAEKRIGHLYPSGENGETPIGWLWARTVLCPNPACRLQVPLIKSYSLCTKNSRLRKLSPKMSPGTAMVTFEIVEGRSTAREGTTSRAGARCPACSTSISYSVIRQEGRAHRMADQLLAIVCQGAGQRLYYPASLEHAKAAGQAMPQWKPDVEIPHNPFSLRPPLYGFTKFSDLFTPRQLCAMSCFSTLVDELPSVLPASAAADYVTALVTYLALSVSRLANRCSSACFWDPTGEKVQQVFARQAIAMAWDYIEANPLSDSSGGFIGQADYLANVVAHSPTGVLPGVVCQEDARKPLPANRQGFILSTDPPYYDNIDYADLSDFFYVWLRRMLGTTYPDLLATVTSPKSQELVATPYRFDGDQDRANEHFAMGLRDTFAHLEAAVSDEIPSSIVYGFKQQEESADDEVIVHASTG